MVYGNLIILYKKIIVATSNVIASCVINFNIYLYNHHHNF